MTQRDKIVTNLEIFLGGLVLGWVSWKIRGFLWKVFLGAPTGIELYRGEDFITYGWSPLVFFAGLGALAFLLISVFLFGYAILALFEFIGQCREYLKLVSTMKNDADWKNRLVAAEALARNKSRRGIDYLNASLESDNLEIRKATEEIISQFKDKTPYNVTQIPISYRTCLKCLHSNPENATKCENCGTTLEPISKEKIIDQELSETTLEPPRKEKMIDQELKGKFLAIWVQVEKHAWDVLDKFRDDKSAQTRSFSINVFNELLERKIIDAEAIEELNSLSQLRNDIVHGDSASIHKLSAAHVEKANEILSLFEKIVTNH